MDVQEFEREGTRGNGGVPNDGSADPSHSQLTERSRGLLAVSESIASCRDPQELFHRLVGQLKTVVPFDVLALVLLQRERDGTSLRVIDTTSMVLTPVPESPGEEDPSGWVIDTQQPLLVPDTATETRWPRAMEGIRQQKVFSFCCLPLTTARRRVGVLRLGSHLPVAYTPADVGFLGEVAKLVSVAVDNARDSDDTQAMQAQLSTERDHLQLLLELTNAVASNHALADLVTAVSSALRRAIPHAFAGLALHEPGSDALVLHAAAFRSANGHQNGHHHEGRRLPLTHSPSGRAFAVRQTLVFGDDELTEFADAVEPLRQEGIRTLCCVPLVVRSLALGTLEVGSLQPDAFTPAAVAVIEEVARQVATAVANALAFRGIAQLNDKLAKERNHLENDIHAEHPFEGIVGESRALRGVLQQVEIVAPTDSTVLVLGETGTGKELIARAMHDRSSRRGRTFVKINCAAIPSGLLESELFGHERGAFTGAVAQKLGRFEVANGGTLFLDEVGDIPLELQPKLLRVLQEQEFERLGGTRTIKVDVRLVAATNRDLRRMVEEHRFRADLYYRLNVFPIHVPPLRERPEDIEALVGYFVRRFARRMQRRIEVIPTEALDAMRIHAWPGNVRELENLIERAVILSPGPRLTVPLAHLAHRSTATAEESGPATLEGVERAYVMRVLEEANWMLSGPRGAAARLGMKRTTLQSLMKRLAITRPS